MNGEPTMLTMSPVSRRGAAYVSILGGNLMVGLREQTFLDLSEQDGRDIADALAEVLSRVAEQRGEGP